MTPAAPTASAVEGPIAASSFAALRSLESFALETTVLVQGSAGTAESISASFAYSAPTRSERLILTGQAVQGSPTRTEIVQVAERTFVAQRESGEWQEVDGTLQEILSGLNLEWLVEPQALLDDGRLRYTGTERVLNARADRYVAPIALLQQIPAFAELQEPTGQIDVWVSTRHNAVIQLIAEAEGKDAGGSSVMLYLETAATSIGEPVDISPPVPVELPTPAPTPMEGESRTISLDDIARAESLPSYRLYFYFVEHGQNDLTAEVMREYQAEPLRDRLVMAARAGDQVAWSEMRQIEDSTWMDGTGSGEWETTDASVSDGVSVQEILPEEILTPLARTPGVLVGEEVVYGTRAERYHWTLAQLAAELGAEESIRDARADVWVSTDHQVPVQIFVYMESASGRLLVQYVVTDVGADIDVAPPEGSPCPEARSLQVNQVVSGEVGAGGSGCFKFIALEGERLTLAADDAQDSGWDPQITVTDDSGRLAHYNDDGPRGYAPLLSFTPERTGVYYAEVAPFGTDRGGAYDLTLAFFDDTTTTTFETAEPVDPGEPVSGTITEDALVYVEYYEHTVFGRAYTFAAQAGQSVTITVLAEEVGSDLDPQVFLFGPHGQPLGHDDDGHGGLDAELTYEVTETGGHYVVVNHASGEPFGTKETYFFEMTVIVE